MDLALIGISACLILGWVTNDKFKACLPEGIELTEIVQADPLPAAASPRKKPITLEQRLVQMKSRCRKGKLVDGAGREIRIVRLIGCWGNPPENYEEQLKKQSEELERLKKKYTVIEISCAQSQDLREIN
jgi:hypothetical protein